MRMLITRPMPPRVAAAAAERREQRDEHGEAEPLQQRPGHHRRQRRRGVSPAGMGLKGAEQRLRCLGQVLVGCSVRH